MIKVSMVLPEHIDSCWKDIEGYLSDAVELTQGRYEIEDLYKLLKDGQFNLWVAYDGVDIKGAVVTHFMYYPRKKYVNLPFCGGKELATWKEEMLRIMRCWAYDNGCDGVEAVGRDGWLKIFKNDGCSKLWQTFDVTPGTCGLNGESRS